jgi:Universal stress protein UspA and related nucleotide-binding proteins
MAKIKKILCAIDLGEHSGLVVDYAATMALGLKAELTVLYVVPDITTYVSFYVPQLPSDMIEQMAQEGNKLMQELVNDKFKSLDIKQVSRIGYVPDEIMNQVEEMDADMIVMGTQGRRGLNRLLLGSVAETIIKSVKIPVLIIRPREAGKPS